MWTAKASGLLVLTTGEAPGKWPASAGKRPASTGKLVASTGLRVASDPSDPLPNV